jgi:glycosyltransferase involved in cell wall biosynthesis
MKQIRCPWNSNHGEGSAFLEDADSLPVVWIWNVNTNRSLGHVAVLLIDIPEVDEGTSLSWRGVPGFPKIGYRRAQVYLRSGGVPFAKLSLNLDDEGYPREPFPEIRPESGHTSDLVEPLSETKPTHPLVTIVVPTAGVRPDLLKRCVKSLTAISYPAFEIVVVDNRSQSMFDEGNEIWSESWIDEPESAVKVTVVRERRPGASYARNTGIAAAHGDIVAFTDDDVEVDSNWLSGIVDAFNSSPEVMCVNGLVIPAELETEAQELFEMFSGGFDRGLVPRSWIMPGRQTPNRNFLKRSIYLVTESLSPEPSPAQSLYVVIGTCGVGANMAVRREFALRYPFDVALGAGSIAQGGEEGRFYADVLWAGFGIMYAPSAIVRHTHRRDMEALNSQMRGYGVGYTALITSLILKDPRHLTGVTMCGAPMALVRWVRSAFSGQSAAEGREQQTSYPASLRRNELIGMTLGPWRYVLSRRRARSLEGLS